MLAILPYICYTDKVMKYTVKNLSDTKVQVSVTLGTEDLETAKQNALVKLAKEVRVAGFRKGKVPVKIAEKHVNPELLASELVERAINQGVVEAFTEAKLQPLDRPQVDVKSYDPEKQLEFTAEVETLPEVKLGDYKKLKATPEKVTVTAKEVDEVIERMRAGFAEKKDVERAAKEKDEVLIDFEGKDEKGELVKGAAGTDYPLTLGSGTFIPGFEEGLIGKKADEEFELPLTFPKDYHAKALAGAKVIFKVKVKSVKEVSLPKVDDEFAKKCGPFESVEQLKKDIKSELTAQKERTRDDKLKDDLARELIAVSTIPTPEILIEDQMRSIEQDTVQNLMYRGVTLDQYLEEQQLTRDEWKEKELKKSAAERVKIGLALAELSKQEKITVSDEEVDARQNQMAQQYPDPNMQAQLKSPEARRDIGNRLMTEKTLDRLVALNVKA